MEFDIAISCIAGIPSLKVALVEVMGWWGSFMKSLLSDFIILSMSSVFLIIVLVIESVGAGSSSWWSILRMHLAFLL